MPEVETRVPPKPRSAAAGGSLSERVQSLRLPPPGRLSGGRVAWYLCAVLLATTIISAGTAISYRSRQTDLQQRLDEAEAKLSEIETARTAVRSPGDPAPGTIALESKGYIIPEQQILVSPQVSGRVIELNFEAGQQVERGFVLAILDDTEYRADQARAKRSWSCRGSN